MHFMPMNNIYTPTLKKKEMFCFIVVCVSVCPSVTKFCHILHRRCLKFKHTLCFGILCNGIYFCTNQTSCLKKT